MTHSLLLDLTYATVCQSSRQSPDITFGQFRRALYLLSEQLQCLVTVFFMYCVQICLLTYLLS